MLNTCPQGTDSCASCLAELAADCDATVPSIAKVDIPYAKMLHFSVHDEEHIVK